MKTKSAEWLYDHLHPYLSRMTRKDATAALLESVDLQHMTLDQADNILKRHATEPLDEARGKPFGGAQSRPTDH